MVAALISLFYEVCGLLGIVPLIGEAELSHIAAMIISILTCAGIVIDPTTKGVFDSAAAMGYEEPKDDSDMVEMPSGEVSDLEDFE